ncbi:MAG: CPBP family intramembrane metalloprotease [Bacteroidetes bacterium]|nr:CPBP family intramembrane metalloprotease [Bacteroidota bacterium]
MTYRKLTLIRVVCFCLLCAIVLATFSGLTKDFLTEWKQHLLLIITIAITYILTMFFTKAEKLQLTNVGVVPGKATFKKIVIGFGIGLFMTLLQLVFVLLFGHYKVALTSSISSYTIIFYLSLYILVAVREELAFRGYPLFSLNHCFGLWTAQIIILIIFSLEHVAGGMTWLQAFFGVGTGALLFGFAALRTNGIALPIGLHTAWNFGQWCLGFKKETGLFHGIVEKGFENVVERNGWISYLTIMTVAVVFLYFYKPKKILIPKTY